MIAMLISWLRPIRRLGALQQSPMFAIDHALKTPPDTSDTSSSPMPKSPSDIIRLPSPHPKPATPDPDREQHRKASPYRGLWQKVSTRIKDRIQPHSFESWIAPLFITEIKGGTIVLDAPDEFFADWLKEHYLWLIKDALLASGLAECEISVGEPDEAVTEIV